MGDIGVIQEKITAINEELQKLDKDIGDRRGFKRTISYRDNGDRRRDGAESYGYQSGLKRRRDTFDDRREMHDDEDDDDFDRRPKRTLQSTVVMPAIETKSRDEKLQELAKAEKKEVVNRNRRMFSNLLQGTLTGFKKTSESEAERLQRREQLIKKVDQDLEEQKQKAKEEAEKERMSKIEKKKELEAEHKSLTRKKALIQYAEAKIAHYKQLSNFIMTSTKPSIFYLPAKHTMRSTELKRNTEKTIDHLIELRKQELQRELEAPLNHQEEEEDQIKSFVAKPTKEEKHKKTAEVKDENELESPKTITVAKKESETSDDEDDGNEADEANMTIE